MSATPAVSVIIPTYNRAHLIATAIDSVLQQTYSDFEIIVVDDASTDDTEAVVNSYGDRARYVKTDHGGVAHARNIGMQLARGKYFTFVDSDDLLYPYALELQTQLLEKFPAASMVCAEMTGFDDHGFEERYHLKNYHRSTFRDPSKTWDTVFKTSLPLPEACAVPQDVLREDSEVLGRRVYFGNIFDSYLSGPLLCQNTVMLRRDVVAEIGPRNEHIFNYEELDYLLRLSRHHNVLFVDVPTYKLRYHPDQISCTTGRDGLLVWIRAQRALRRVIKFHAVADQGYYRRYQHRIDPHLAELHRSTAVPMMLVSRSEAAGHRYGRYIKYARLCLRRCWRYGRPQYLYYALSFAPGPVRRVAVKSIEGIRKFGLASLFTRGLAGVRKRVSAAMTNRASGVVLARDKAA